MSLIRRVFARPAEMEQRVFEPTWASVPPPGDPWGAPVAGTHGNWANFGGSDDALRFLAVFACVRLLADAVAGLPIDVCRKVQGQPRAVLSTAPQWLGSPFPDEYTTFEWIWKMVSSLALRGNSYHYKVRDDMGRLIALLPLHPDDVQVTTINMYSSNPTTEYRIFGEAIPKEDILHVRRFPQAGGVMGLSPIGVARTSISIGIGADTYGDRYFRDSASPSSVLETEQDLSEAAAQRLAKQWRASHGGRRFPAVLSGGLTWKAISLAPDDSQFLQTKAFQRAEIAMLYGVPPHMIGDTEKSTSWGTGIEQQSIGFAKFTLGPWLSCIEQAFTQLLPRGQYVKFNIDGLLRGDQKARYEAYEQARNAGWLSVNEIRAMEDLDPIPGGDTYIQPLNGQPMSYQQEPSTKA